MEFYISPQRGQFYMINVLENQWLSVTYSVKIRITPEFFFAMSLFLFLHVSLQFSCNSQHNNQIKMKLVFTMNITKSLLGSVRVAPKMDWKVTVL